MKSDKRVKRVIVRPPGSAGCYDPLEQYGYIAVDGRWIRMIKCHESDRKSIAKLMITPPVILTLWDDSALTPWERDIRGR